MEVCLAVVDVSSALGAVCGAGEASRLLHINWAGHRRVEVGELRIEIREHLPAELRESGLGVIVPSDALHRELELVLLGIVVGHVLIADLPFQRVHPAILVEISAGAGGGRNLRLGIVEDVLLFRVLAVLLSGEEAQHGATTRALAEIHGEVHRDVGRALLIQPDVYVDVLVGSAWSSLRRKRRHDENEQACQECEDAPGGHTAKCTDGPGWGLSPERD